MDEETIHNSYCVSESARLGFIIIPVLKKSLFLMFFGKGMTDIQTYGQTDLQTGGQTDPLIQMRS